jgi:hypothetical protein
VNTIVALLVFLVLLTAALLWLDRPRDHDDTADRERAQEEMRVWLDEHRRDDR